MCDLGNYCIKWQANLPPCSGRIKNQKGQQEFKGPPSYKIHPGIHEMFIGQFLLGHSTGSHSANTDGVHAAYQASC